MKKIAALFLGLAIAVIAPPTRAAGFVNFTLTASGTTPALTCVDASLGVVTFTSGTGTIVPQGSTNGSPFTTITTIGAGSIGTNGVFSGAIPPATQIQAVVTVSTGPVIGSIGCTNQNVSAGGGSQTFTCASPGCVIANPAATISPGGMVGVSEAGPSSPPGPINGANVGVIDSSGNRATYVCNNQTNLCAGVVSGSGKATLLAGLFGNHVQSLSAAVSTCTDITSSATIIISIAYPNTTAQTGTLTVYNDSGTCTGTVLYSRATPAATTFDPWLIFANTGVAYKWTTAACSGTCLLSYL